MKITVKVTPTYIIPIDPTRELTEEIIPTFELAQKVPPPPGEEGLSKTSGFPKFSSLDDLLIRIPKLLTSEPVSIQKIQASLNAQGEDNQDPEILDALELLVSEGAIQNFEASWFRQPSIRINLRVKQ